ncbi:MAG: STAS domain-containing protein [Candidatus Pelagadaptatus aseana]|uniref:STAS domain-containing protein n=1 Tax=Candidatus Pelagadaptatus aseana TaxID=3120508 RepID=UPI0039B1953D
MKPGSICVADRDGVNVIKMSGDVRLTLCLSFDAYIEDMFTKDDFHTVVFDLSEAEAVDSTTLGLMAKISLIAKDRGKSKPTIISTSPGIQRLLGCMGFDQIFEIVEHIEADFEPDDCLTEGAMDEAKARQKVIEAHKILMSLNEKNASTFRDLMNALESS